MTIDALGGGTALTSTLAGLTGSLRAPARAQAQGLVEPEPVRPDPARNVQEASADATEGVEAPSEEDQVPDAKSVSDIARSLAENAREEVSTRLSILYEQDVDLFVSRRVDPESGEVVRQFPYEEQLDRIRFFSEQSADEPDEHIDFSV